MSMSISMSFQGVGCGSFLSGLELEHHIYIVTCGMTTFCVLPWAACDTRDTQKLLKERFTGKRENKMDVHVLRALHKN